IVEQTRRDLHTLRALFDLKAETLIGLVEAAVPELEGGGVPRNRRGPDENPSPRRTLAHTLLAEEDWEDLAETLTVHYATHGAGPFGRYRAFRWQNGGRLPGPRA